MQSILVSVLTCLLLLAWCCRQQPQTSTSASKLATEKQTDNALTNEISRSQQMQDLSPEPKASLQEFSAAMQVEPDHSEASKPVTIDHKYIRNHWQQYLEVFSPVPPDNNPPGVYGYRLKLKNKFPYDLDSLVILVSYYAGGECIAVNYVRMSAMSSGAQIFVAVPDNSHARTFRYQVRKVICRKAELCFDIDHLHFGDDPYRCAGSS